MLSAPCKDCAERHPGCHSECERYKEYSREQAQGREKRRIDGEYAAVRGAQVDKAERKKWSKRRR